LRKVNRVLDRELKLTMFSIFRTKKRKII